MKIEQIAVQTKIDTNSLIVMKEIEKKYLIKDGTKLVLTPSFLKLFPSIEDLVREVAQKGQIIRQGYLTLQTAELLIQKLELNPSFTPKEARLRQKNNLFYFTLKGEGTIEREELEVTLSKELFESYWLETENRRIEKIRLKKPYEGHVAEFDVYINRLLIVAEIEFQTIEEASDIAPLGEDISNDKRYKNKNLAL